MWTFASKAQFIYILYIMSTLSRGMIKNIFMIIILYWPYSKGKLEMKSNLSEIFSVDCKFIHSSTLTKFNKTQI